MNKCLHDYVVRDKDGYYFYTSERCVKCGHKDGYISFTVRLNKQLKQLEFDAYMRQVAMYGGTIKLSF